MFGVDDENEDETNDSPTNREQAETLIRMYLKSGKFKEAIQVWKTLEEFDVENKENIEQIMEEFLERLKEIYTTGMSMMEMVTGSLSEEDLKKLETLKVKVISSEQHQLKIFLFRKTRNFLMRQWLS